MTLTKKMWADPEFRKKMRAKTWDNPEFRAKMALKKRGKFQDLDPMKTTDQEQNRTYYIELPKNWKKIKHINPKSIEQSLEVFCKELQESGQLSREAAPKRTHKKKSDFNNGPLTFTKEKIDEWHQRQEVEKPIDIPEEMI